MIMSMQKNKERRKNYGPPLQRPAIVMITFSRRFGRFQNGRFDRSWFRPGHGPVGQDWGSSRPCSLFGSRPYCLFNSRPPDTDLT
jgi:hypothetical protein